jgi:NAD(P)-dependent dehydrogenase (short-subunit alcohol dehydrogenase family)
MSEGIKGSRILVVGASAGIGRAIAKRAVREGASVAFAARRSEQLEAAISEAGGGVAVTADVRRPGDPARMVESALDALGGIDALVYATGVSPLQRLADSDTDTWAQVLETNLVGVHETVRAALPHLEPQAIVGVLSSDSVGAPRPGLVPYAASKAALEELLRGWRTEHPHIRWACLTVGPTVPTEFGVNFDPQLVGELFADWSRLGMIHETMMDADAVAHMITTSIGLLLEHPGIGIEHLVLRPASGIIGSVTHLDDAFEENANLAGGGAV